MMHGGWQKGTCRAKAMLNGEEIKPVVVEFEGIS